MLLLESKSEIVEETMKHARESARSGGGRGGLAGSTRIDSMDALRGFIQAGKKPGQRVGKGK